MVLKSRPRDEAPPVAIASTLRPAPVAPAAPRRPLPLGAQPRAVGVLAELRAATRPSAFFDALNAPPLLQADFAAWLADDWTHVNDRLDNLDDATAREFAAWRAAAEYAPRVATDQLLSELTELTAVQLTNWRQALRVHAEDELALFADAVKAGG